MKLQFSKNKSVRASQPIKLNSKNETNLMPVQTVFSSQRRNYDMIAIANSGSKCSSCNK